MIKGKILLLASLLLALVLTAGAAGSGYLAGAALEMQFGATFVAYDWNMIKIVCAAVCGVLTLLFTLPNVIVARQVCRMYKVSRKYAKWSPVTIIIGLLMLALTAGSIGYVVYFLQNIPGVLLISVESMLGIEIDIQLLQIVLSVSIFSVALLMFLPLLVALRSRDGVSALLKKKRTYSEEEV